MRLTLAMTVGAALMVGAAAACGGGQPEPVTPAVDTAAIRDSIEREEAAAAAAEQARRDSLERARRMDEERIRREREESLARARAETADVRAMFAEAINFDFDRSNIRPGRDTEVLEQKLAILEANPALRIEIVGHCDERGSDEYNLALGNRRAVSAMSFLANRGISADRIAVRSMGEEQPVDPGHNEDAWQQNRRDEFVITGGGDALKKPGM